MNQHDWLEAGPAAALLGVKRATLYAYVSRGLVRRAGARPRRYAREDLERLRVRHQARTGHAPVAAAALRWGEPVLETSITTIDATGLRYRGQDALALSATTGFEAVADLLFGVPCAPWPAPLPFAAIRELVPRGTRPLDALLAIVPVLALGDRDRHAHAPAAELSRARSLVRTLAAALALGRDRRAAAAALSAPTVAAAAARALGADVALVDRILVLCADHELNASTFTARIAASAGADLDACLTAALGTMSGPLHGAASERVAAFFDEVGTPARARAVVSGRLRRGETIPGFGHRLYAAGDPRAQELLRLTPSPLVAAIARACGQPANLDAALVVTTAGLPPGSASALFALGRTAGWIAHALEQRAQGFLIRPRARNAG